MNSFLSYFGGKSRLVPTIVPMIPDHVTYCEPFAGAAWVLFGKPESKNEIINDINSDLMNLFRVIQNHLEEFMRYFKYALVSREEYGRLKTLAPEALTDIQRAVRFYYLSRLGFAGQVTEKGRHFSVSYSRRPALNLLRMEETLSEVHLRLARVWIETLHYREFIDRYDRPGTFFYIDSPYHGAETAYGPTFSFDDFGLLADQLHGIKGKFLLSINDTPKMRKAFEVFHVESVQTSWVTKREGNQKVSELLVRNY